MFANPALAALIRWGTFVAMLTTIGASVFGTIVLALALRRSGLASLTQDGQHPLSAARIERRAAQWGLIGVLALVPLAFGRLVTQVAQLREAAEPWLPPAAMMLSETTWGIGWWVQISATLLCGGGFLLVLRRAGHRAGWRLAALGTLALAATPALSGHAIGAPRFAALAVVADTLHVLGAGAWLGSLAVMLASVIHPARREADNSALVPALFVRAFSPVALGSTGLVVISGVVGSWMHLGTLPALWETTYGRFLLAKLALFGLVVALGAWNWRRLTPRLTSNRGVTNLTHAARAELVTAVLILLVTAALVATPLPGE